MAAPLTLQEVSQQQALAEGYANGPTPTVNNANLNTQAGIGNPLVPVTEPTPYFPPTTITPNLGLTLIGLDDTEAQNMVLIDAAVGSGGGGSSTAIQTVVAAYQPSQTDGTILANGTFTITLVTTLSKGTTFRIKNIGTGIVTVASSVNIDGATTYVLNPYQYASIDVQWDGTQWWVL
jgi:hypothetical protein